MKFIETQQIPGHIHGFETNLALVLAIVHCFKLFRGSVVKQINKLKPKISLENNFA